MVNRPKIMRSVRAVWASEIIFLSHNLNLSLARRNIKSDGEVLYGDRSAQLPMDQELNIVWWSFSFSRFDCVRNTDFWPHIWRIWSNLFWNIIPKHLSFSETETWSEPIFKTGWDLLKLGNTIPMRPSKAIYSTLGAIWSSASQEFNIDGIRNTYLWP